MKCPKCNGRGTVGYFHIDHFVDIECDRCNGSGEVQMTNEEWLRSLNTEQLAEFLFDIGEYDWLREIAVTSDKALRITDIAEWLKQPHQ